MYFFAAIFIGLSACVVLKVTSHYVASLDVDFTWPAWTRSVSRVFTFAVAGGLSAYFLTTLPFWFAMPLAVFAVFLTVLTVIDAQTMLLPDILTLPLLGMGLLANSNQTVVSFQDAVLGAVLGYLVPLLIALYYRRFRGHDGIGLGDVKLIAALGAWLGWQALPTLAVLASGIHLVLLAIIFLVSRSNDSVIEQPFGPALGAAGVVLVL